MKASEIARRLVYELETDVWTWAMVTNKNLKHCSIRDICERAQEKKTRLLQYIASLETQVRHKEELHERQSIRSQV